MENIFAHFWRARVFAKQIVGLMLNCVLFYFMSHNSGIGVRYTQSPYSLKKTQKLLIKCSTRFLKKEKEKDMQISFLMRRNCAEGDLNLLKKIKIPKKPQQNADICSLLSCTQQLLLSYPVLLRVVCNIFN